MTVMGDRIALLTLNSQMRFQDGWGPIRRLLKTIDVDTSEAICTSIGQAEDMLGFTFVLPDGRDLSVYVYQTSPGEFAFDDRDADIPPIEYESQPFGAGSDLRGMAQQLVTNRRSNAARTQFEKELLAIIVDGKTPEDAFGC